jgi:hypothetical protein
VKTYYALNTFAYEHWPKVLVEMLQVLVKAPERARLRRIKQIHDAPNGLIPDCIDAQILSRAPIAETAKLEAKFAKNLKKAIGLAGFDHVNDNITKMVSAGIIEHSEAIVKACDKAAHADGRRPGKSKSKNLLKKAVNALNRELCYAGRELRSERVGTRRSRTMLYTLHNIKFLRKKNGPLLEDCLKLMQGDSLKCVIRQHKMLEPLRTPEGMEKIARQLLRRIALRRIDVLRRNVKLMKTTYGSIPVPPESISVQNYESIPDTFGLWQKSSKIDHARADRALALKRARDDTKPINKKRKRRRVEDQVPMEAYPFYPLLVQ